MCRPELGQVYESAQHLLGSEVSSSGIQGMISKKRRKLLFVHGYPPGQVSSFVRQDLRLLGEMYQVEVLALSTIPMLRGPLSSLAVWEAVNRNDVVFCWFMNAPVVIIAKILGKPSLVVAGGGDAVSIPEIGYGPIALRKRRRFLTRLGFRLASGVLLFSDSSRQNLLSWLGRDFKNTQTLYLSVDTTHFIPHGTKRAQVLTIGYIKESNLRRKGLNTFVAAAKETPEIPYRLGGKPTEHSTFEKIREMASPNLSLLGYLDDAQLLKEYQCTKVYAQLSMHEGFGVALAEAMACECVPVVTRQGAIPEVVGDTGVYVPLEDPLAASEAIREVIRDSKSEILARRARQRIVDLFPVSRRREGVRVAIETLGSKR